MVFIHFLVKQISTNTEWHHFLTSSKTNEKNEGSLEYATSNRYQLWHKTDSTNLKKKKSRSYLNDYECGRSWQFFCEKNEWEGRLDDYYLKIHLYNIVPYLSLNDAENLEVKNSTFQIKLRNLSIFITWRCLTNKHQLMVKRSN